MRYCVHPFSLSVTLSLSKPSLGQSESELPGLLFSANSRHVACCLRCGFVQSHLLQCVAELKDLSLSLHLPHAQLAAELRGGRAQPLQREGAMESPLAAAPHLVERDLLGEKQTKNMMDMLKEPDGCDSDAIWT